MAANGDTANKIGTYALAVLAKHHGVPFYIGMPTSTLDRRTPTGADIVIEQRAADEVTHLHGVAIAPQDTAVWNPAFDVTPAELITGWVTEHGVWTTPFPQDPHRRLRAATPRPERPLRRGGRGRRCSRHTAPPRGTAPR